MAAKIKTFVLHRVMMLVEDKPSYQLYTEMFAPLLVVCKRHDAVLDLTDVRCPVVLGCTARCRRAIRALYGEEVQETRIGKCMYLRGF